MKNIIFTNEQIFSVYKLSYSISESRGKNRQTILNSIIIDSLKNTGKYEGCEFKSEVRMKPLWGKYFPVDIAIYKDNKLVEIVLAKAPGSNVKQNKVNTMNSINSDIDRLSKHDIKISLINFLPNLTPFFKRDESIKNFEKNNPDFLMKSGIVKGVDIDEIFITFDIQNLKNCVSKSDVRTIFQNSNPISNINITEYNYVKLTQNV